jgi:hypothetical protein
MRTPLLLVLALAGCIGAPAADAPSCEAPALGAAGPRVVHLEVANTMDRAACIRVLFDGAIVGAKALPAEAPALHANPGPAGDVRWPRDTVLVRIEEAGTGHGHEERVTLGQETWVVGWLDENGGNVETYDQQPAWM